MLSQSAPRPPVTARLPSVAGIRGDDRGYLAYHAPRYRFLLEVISRHLPATGARVLEIGPSPLGPLLAAILGCAVDSLGLEPEADGVHGHHFRFDLDGCPGAPEPPGMPRYDLVVFAEVIEHLHTSPVHTLAFVRRPFVGAIKNGVYRALPRFLREGLTLVLRKETRTIPAP